MTRKPLLLLPVLSCLLASAALAQPAPQKSQAPKPAPATPAAGRPAITVKRVADVGLFIDAGLDGEGFLHVSEYRPLGKAKGTEYHEGDPITVWVKAVAPDLKSFRATLKEPLKYEMSDLKPGMVVTG